MMMLSIADLKRAAAASSGCARKSGTADQLVYTTEFMHPRMDEVTGSLPFALGGSLRTVLLVPAARYDRQSRARVKSGDCWFVALSFLPDSSVPPWHAQARRESSIATMAGAGQGRRREGQ